MRAVKYLLTTTFAVGLPVLLESPAAQNVMIPDVPNYSWHAGCFGTASGNLMGYWDRTGLPNLYTGPTAGGIAPLNSIGANRGIRSMWASRAGFDGRPADQPGHIDDYWEYFSDTSYSYESPRPDPYTILGRTEHEPDCLGDFMGASQNKWSDFDGECAGNIDAFAFNFWDKGGARRWNFVPPDQNGEPMRDVQSGIRLWSNHRGYSAHVFSQLADFNPETPSGTGFTFEDLKAEIDAGYPVMLFLQNPGNLSRTVFGVAGMNPNVHAMVAYGYVVLDTGDRFVRFRDSWAGGDLELSPWGPQPWRANLTLRGVIGVRPLPKITGMERENGSLVVRWDAPASSVLFDPAGTATRVHSYVLEKANSVGGPYEPVSEPTRDFEMTVPDAQESQVFFRVRLIELNPAPSPE